MGWGKFLSDRNYFQTEIKIFVFFTSSSSSNAVEFSRSYRMCDDIHPHGSQRVLVLFLVLISSTASNNGYKSHKQSPLRSSVDKRVRGPDAEGESSCAFSAGKPLALLKGATELCSNVMCSLDSSVKHLGRPNDPMRLFTVRSTLSVTRTHLTKASSDISSLPIGSAQTTLLLFRERKNSLSCWLACHFFFPFNESFCVFFFYPKQYLLIAENKQEKRSTLKKKHQLIC